MPSLKVGGRSRRKKDIRMELLARDGRNCFLCGTPVDFDAEPLSGDYPTIEHKSAKANGGTNSLANLALAHRRCNERKGDKPLGKAWRTLRSGPLPNPVKATR